MKYLSLVLLALILFACNGGEVKPDCSETADSLSDCQEDFSLMANINSSLTNQLNLCYQEVDSLKEIYPDTIYLHIVDTLVLRDTIIKSDTIYQVDTVCVAGPECDTVMVKKVLLVNGDTNWWIKPYVRCPLENYQVATDIVIRGYSTGMHTEDGGYSFGCLKVLVNGSDSLIYFGKRICLDIPFEYLNQAYYTTRVLLPIDSIRTITYEFYNDGVGTWEGENEDINVFIYGLLMGEYDILFPSRITLEGGSIYWQDHGTYLQINQNGSFTVHIK